MANPRTPGNPRGAIPLRRVVTAEVRKMFDTISGLWLMASIANLAVPPPPRSLRPRRETA